MSLKLRGIELSVHKKLSQSGIDSQTKILVACSGGQDSVVLVHLLKKLNYTIAIAHCNFQLRGQESEEDQAFVEQLAHHLQIPLFLKRFDVKSYCTEHQISTQMAARELRYAWFSQVMDSEQYEYLATAHHQEDSLETQLLNFSKGSIINGLTGIAYQNGTMIRPLYQTPKDAIELYAANHQLAWRHDSSNDSEDYQRNLLRLSIIPRLKQINPSLAQTLQRSGEIRAHLADFLYAEIADDRTIILRMALDKSLIPWESFSKMHNNPAVLYLHLDPLGFSYDQACNIIDSKSSTETKRFKSAEYELFVSANGLQLCSAIAQDAVPDLVIPAIGHYAVGDGMQLILEEREEYIQPERADKHIIWAEADNIHFPLRLRHKQEGDYFLPLGMERKKKRVSAYLKDSKIPLPERQEIWILEDAAGEIIWIVNFHPSENIRVADFGKKMIRISFQTCA